MSFLFKRILIVFVLLFLLVGNVVTFAENFPDRPIEIVVPFEAGGGNDIFARAVAKELTNILKIPVIVTNQPGAGGLVALSRIERTEPDGYTIVTCTPGSVALAKVLQGAEIDLREFTPLISYSEDATGIFVHPDLPYNTFPELVDAYQKGELTIMAGADVGNYSHIAVELVKDIAGLDYQDYISYRGTAPAIAATIRNEVNVISVVSGTAAPFVKDEEIKAIAVLSSNRLNFLPETPSFTEYGYESIDGISKSTRMFIGPPGIPKDRQAILEKALLEAVNTPEFKEWTIQTDHPSIDGNADYTEKLIKETYEIILGLDLSKYEIE